MFAGILDVLVKTVFFDLVGPYEFSFTSISCSASALRDLCISHFVQIATAALVKHNELRTSNGNSDSVRIWPTWPYASVNKGLLISITGDIGLNLKCFDVNWALGITLSAHAKHVRRRRKFSDAWSHGWYPISRRTLECVFI